MSFRCLNVLQGFHKIGHTGRIRNRQPPAKKAVRRGKTKNNETTPAGREQVSLGQSAESDWSLAHQLLEETRGPEPIPSPKKALRVDPKEVVDLGTETFENERSYAKFAPVTSEVSRATWKLGSSTLVGTFNPLENAEGAKFPPLTGAENIDFGAQGQVAPQIPMERRQDSLMSAPLSPPAAPEPLFWIKTCPKMCPQRVNRLVAPGRFFWMKMCQRVPSRGTIWGKRGARPV